MKILRIMIHLILFVSVLSTILPDALSKTCINLIVVCTISMIIISSLGSIRYSEYNFSVQKYVDEYIEHSENFKNNVNIYFDDIRKVTENEKQIGNN